MASSPSLAGVRLLLVDNDPGVSTLLRSWFEHLGARVACADTAEGGLARLEEGEGADLVLLDLRMPGIGGLGFLERWRGDPPVLVCSGFVGAEEGRRIEAHPSVRGILRKPFDLLDLTEAVTKALRGEAVGKEERGETLPPPYRGGEAEEGAPGAEEGASPPAGTGAAGGA